MRFKAYLTILFTIFSFVMASNALKDKDYHPNYKSNTLEQKIEQMELLELSSLTPVRRPNIEALKKGLMIKSQIDLAGKAASIGKERMIPSAGNRDCEGLSEDECAMIDWCMWNYEDAVCMPADEEGEVQCDDGYLQDCSGDGDCCPESWVGDGLADCEDQSWGCDLTCYDNDGGDCAGEGDGGGDDGNADDGGTGGDDGGSECVDCVGNDCSGYEHWIGDGICDEGEYGIFYNCLAFDCDGGDCGFDSNGECESNWEDDGGDDGENEGCEDGYVDDCSGDGDCCPENWIGDGYLDCEDPNNYGCDLTCYDNDGGDCEENADDGGNELSCSDISSDDCEYIDLNGDGALGDCMLDEAGNCVDNDAEEECQNYDCMDQCYDGYEGWIGDGWCDDGSRGLYFNCEEFDCDYGDCIDPETGDCAGNTGDGGDDGGDWECSDLGYEDCMYYDFCEWISDSNDPATGGECVDANWEDDGGNEGCDDGYIEDCADDDCCPEGWIGDGFIDCEDQAYGCDLSCYDNDGGDCEDGWEDDGGDDGGDWECSDLGYEDCIYVDDCEWNPGWDDGAGGFCVEAGWSDGGGNEGCSEGYIEDCADDDCCPESWVGDGFTDCEDQPYGCDLTCYDNDGGDCEESGDDGGNDEIVVALIPGSASGVPGGEVEIPILMESSEVVAGIQFSLLNSPADWASSYDLTLTADNDCFEANFNNLGDGFTIGLIYSLSGCEFEPSDESYQIATLSYEISSDAAFGSDIQLYFEELIVASSSGEQLNAAGYDGTITIGMIGDVNHDGSIDVIDAVTMINFVLMFEEPSDSQYWAADINEDGTLNVLDVVLLVDMILED